MNEEQIVVRLNNVTNELLESTIQDLMQTYPKQRTNTKFLWGKLQQDWPVLYIGSAYSDFHSIHTELLLIEFCGEAK